MTASPIIGIDLGTTNCCVAVMVDDEVLIIPNDCGDNTTPSYVGFTGIETIVGREAKDLTVIDPENVVFDMKRIIGLKFNESEVQSDIKRWPFKVVNDDNANPRIKIKKTNKLYAPEEISAMVLHSLKRRAEDFLGVQIKSAVITIPARFKVSQKEATIDAAKIAGLKVKQLLIEPTAAAIAYGIKYSSKRIRNILIYDLGGGTFDVSILRIEDKNFQVLATDGNTHLGGEDFDDQLVAHFVKEFIEKHNIDQEVDNKAIRRLKTACEIIKKKLSTASEARINLDIFIGNTDLQSLITREQFERMNETMFASTLDCVKNALKLAKLEVEEIDDVVLVGGSTRIPKIRQMLQAFFKVKSLKQNVNPDEVIAYGAAIRATQLDGSILMKDIKLEDTIPFSIGIPDSTGNLIKIIERNSTYPTEGYQLWTNPIDYMSSFTFDVYEGENPIAEENHRLGTIFIDDVPLGLCDTIEVLTTLKIDENGILTVKGQETSTGQSSELTVSYNSGRLSSQEIARMMAEAEKSRASGERRLKIHIAKKQIEIFCYNARSRITSPLFENKLSETEKKQISETCEAALIWINNENLTIDQCQERINALKNLCIKIDLDI